MASVLAYAGSGIIVLWGIGHLIPTRGIVAGFGPISGDNTHVIAMEWIAEGLTLCFLGVLSAAVWAAAGPTNPATDVVLRLCAGMLLVLATLSSFTGARTSVLPMKLCPVVKTIVAAMLIAATVVA